MNVTQPNKWALLIGINKYPLLAPYYQLSGCVNDVELMADILQHSFGFPAKQITLLKDEQATRDGILAAMNQLVEQAGENDIVLLGYSGHGSQMTDREGDEPDGKDETIMPHNSGRYPYPNRDITDDEIYAWLLKVAQKTPYVTLIFDCCHSGTISRDVFGTASRWVEPDLRPIEELPPSPVSREVAHASSRDVGGSGLLPIGERYVLIAACQDKESAYEYKARQNGQVVLHGALTYFLSQALTKAAPGATYREIFELASTQLTAAESRQHPQMEGVRNRELFGVRDIEPMRFVPVKERKGDLITLRAGAAHGITVGSQWAIYPSWTRQVDAQTSRLGLVEITAVRAVSSDARITSETSPNAIMVGARAVEEAHFYGEMRLVVDIQAPAELAAQVEQLEQTIADSNLLRRANAGEPADARIYIIPPRTEATRNDPVPQLQTITAVTWAVVGQDGLLLMPLHTVDDTNAIYVLRDNLEKVVRYSQALALDNPSQDSPLKGKVEFVFKRKEAGKEWVVAQPEDASGQVIFAEGDRMAAQITNHHKEPIYISILDFGLTGAVSLVYPVEGASETLAPGRTIEIGIRQGDEIELYVPDNFPYLPYPEDQTPVGGTETFMLLATTHEADFSSLVQEPYRGVRMGGAKGTNSPLGQLMELALTGCGTRDLRRTQLPPDEAWITVKRSFFLRRNGL